jgi:hypothetical protein
MPPETWFLVLQESKAVVGAYERVGIGTQDTRDNSRGAWDK